jgi:hypothetical protein
MSAIQELMNRDPLSLTKDDATEVVKWMREQRHLFKAQPAKAATSKKTAKEQAVASLAAELKL